MTLTDTQHAARAAGIGGSDAPTIALVNPYQQPIELYMQKIGDWAAPDLSDVEAVRFGHLLEPMIADEWARRHEMQVRRDATTHRHDDHEWMIGHIDRRVLTVRAGLEIKNRSSRMAHHYGKGGTDEIYEADMVQCQHYLAVTGWDRWHVAVYLGGGDYRDYVVERDEALIADLIALEADFWECVQTRTPPELAFTHGTIGAMLDRLYPGTDATVLDLPEQAEHWHQVLVDAAVERRRYQQVEDGARAHLRALMGSAAVGLLPQSEGGYTRKIVKRAGYTVEDTQYLDFRYTKKPRGVNKQ